MHPEGSSKAPRTEPSGDLVHEGGRVAQQWAGVEPRRPRAERGVEGRRVRREAEGGGSPVRVREVGRDEEGDLCSQMDRFREGSEKAQGRVLLATRRERSPACWTPREGGRGRGRAGGSRSRRQTRGCTATAGDRACARYAGSVARLRMMRMAASIYVMSPLWSASSWKAEALPTSHQRHGTSVTSDWIPSSSPPPPSPS